MYQGHDALESAYPARLAAALGAKIMIVTNAAGGVVDGYVPGDIMLISDHINMTGRNPLIGWAGPEGGTPFVPMDDAYSSRLRVSALEVSKKMGVSLKEGIYVGLLGPNYETPAEVGMLRGLGADAVGMSTVSEVIVARALGMEVLGISLITNVAADTDLSHTEVLEVGARAADTLSDLILGVLEQVSE